MRCLEVHDQMHLDRLLWCDRCRSLAHNRAGWWGWVGGWAFGLGVAAFIWITIRPSDLVIGGWFGTVAMAIWLGAKAGREIAYGVMRFSNHPAADAVPPRLGGEIDPPEAV